MYKIVHKQIRPNTSTPFWAAGPNTSPAFKAYMQDTYINTGKLISTTAEPSNDGLELTVTTMWPDAATFNQFKNDPQVIENIINASANYRDANNIGFVAEFEGEI